MKIHTTYKVKLHGNQKAFADTVKIYRRAVDYLIGVCLSEWHGIAPIPRAHDRMTYVERLTHRTAGRSSSIDFIFSV